MSERSIGVEGLNSQWDFVTLQADSSIVYDRTQALGTALAYAPVKITGDKTIGLADDDDEIYGTLCSVEHDGACRIGKGNVQPFRNPGDLVIGTGSGQIPAGSPVVGAADNTVKAGTAGAGTGAVLSTGRYNNVDVVFVDLK